MIKQEERTQTGKGWEAVDPVHNIPFLGPAIDKDITGHVFMPMKDNQDFSPGNLEF